LYFFVQKKNIEKKTKNHQKSIDLSDLLTTNDFLDFIKKFKNGINILSLKKLYDKK